MNGYGGVQNLPRFAVVALVVGEFGGEAAEEGAACDVDFGEGDGFGEGEGLAFEVGVGAEDVAGGRGSVAGEGFEDVGGGGEVGDAARVEVVAVGEAVEDYLSFVGFVEEGEVAVASGGEDEGLDEGGLEVSEVGWGVGSHGS
ncbi:hypothetical protein [Mucisphaera sp.]|uniref:hypothetical protein n=1 Tax=Mucisphaera sp. TaxID=2913024 RepID=UPI003D0DC202